jgi:hypothetical protein
VVSFLSLVVTVLLVVISLSRLVLALWLLVASSR